jgi:hypothetical protein
MDECCMACVDSTRGRAASLDRRSADLTGHTSSSSKRVRAVMIVNCVRIILFGIEFSRVKL